MGFQCGVVGGAPVIAASTGAYVAGTVPTELGKELPETIESEPAKPVDRLDPRKTICYTADAQQLKRTTRLDSREVESQWRLEQARSESGCSATAPTEKDSAVPEIPLGYSPSSRKTSSESSHASKYDKYYHQWFGLRVISMCTVSL